METIELEVNGKKLNILKSDLAYFQTEKGRQYLETSLQWYYSEPQK